VNKIEFLAKALFTMSAAMMLVVVMQANISYQQKQLLNKDPIIIETLQKTVLQAQPCIERIDCLKLAETIYHEARGENEVGQIAVAYVVMNRVKSAYYPNSIIGVINKRCHFSYKCDGSYEQGITDIVSFQKALNIANGVINGMIDDPTKGADHYFNPTTTINKPDWASIYPKVVSIGQHEFHKRAY
jgi:spore germination cell wall hydrolase CwlJ-like protein